MSEAITTNPEPVDASDDEVPPAVICTSCWRVECPGCEAASLPVPSAPVLAWEAGGRFRERLWRTALQSSTEPQRTFGSLPEGRIAPALGFAFVAETLAIVSLASAVLLAGLAIAPELCARIVSDPVSAGFIASAIVGASALMVGLHALWGVCLELGASSTGNVARFRQGVRFGLYACGWDLLTSPAGVLQGLAARGLRGAFGPIREAVRVPRTAMRAYLEEHRRLDRRAQRCGLRLCVAVLGGAMLMIVVGAILAFGTIIGWSVS